MCLNQSLTLHLSRRPEGKDHPNRLINDPFSRFSIQDALADLLNLACRFVLTPQLASHLAPYEAVLLQPNHEARLLFSSYCVFHLEGAAPDDPHCPHAPVVYDAAGSLVLAAEAVFDAVLAARAEFDAVLATRAEFDAVLAAQASNSPSIPACLWSNLYISYTDYKLAHGNWIRHANQSALLKVKLILTTIYLSYPDTAADAKATEDHRALALVNQHLDLHESEFVRLDSHRNLYRFKRLLGHDGPAHVPKPLGTPFDERFENVSRACPVSFILPLTPARLQLQILTNFDFQLFGDQFSHRVCSALANSAFPRRLPFYDAFLKEGTFAINRLAYHHSEERNLPLQTCLHAISLEALRIPLEDIFRFAPQDRLVFAKSALSLAQLHRQVSSGVSKWLHIWKFLSSALDSVASHFEVDFSILASAKTCLHNAMARNPLPDEECHVSQHVQVHALCTMVAHLKQIGVELAKPLFRQRVQTVLSMSPYVLLVKSQDMFSNFTGERLLWVLVFWRVAPRAPPQSDSNFFLKGALYLSAI